jgi:DNA-binding SARP family transcriptional activator
VEFRLLGALEVEAENGSVPVGEPQQQVVLATLLLEPGRAVSVHRLAEAVWGERPPATAHKQILNRAGILRRLFARYGCGTAVIVTERSGYRLADDGVVIDTRLFDERVRLAREHRAAGRLTEAADLLREGLALWRGPLLDGLASSMLRRAAAGWEERRMAVLDERMALELALGRHHELLYELAELVQTRPLSECLRGKYMVALHRAGRRAAALETFQDIRRALDTELGIEPGVPLHQLQLQILRSDPELDEMAPEAMLAAMALAERNIR